LQTFADRLQLSPFPFTPSPLGPITNRLPEFLSDQ
jgi:hypothetical protein